MRRIWRVACPQMQRSSMSQKMQQGVSESILHSLTPSAERPVQPEVVQQMIDQRQGSKAHVMHNCHTLVSES